MTPEERAVEEASAQKEFSIVRKGYDPAEVDAQLAEYDEALSEFEGYVARLGRELQDARREIARMKAAEKDAVEKAMAAVFDAKERIIDRAVAKAKEIENQALTTAGRPTVELPAIAIPDLVETPSASADSATGVGPDDVLQQMLTEAATIRTRLDVGLAAAFDQMEQMQQDAEQRASSMLDEAKRESERLRATAAVTAAETIIEVQLPGEAPPPQDRPRQSRYSRNSAGLPRIGEDGEASVIETMKGLRTKFRESEEATR
ncbi:MAG: hypothetical protein GY788_16820 [bacterium]|nr:hypothetical protein [bacterium]